MFVLGVADGAVEISFKGTAPTSENAARLERRQPLPGRAMLLAMTISNGRCCRRRARSGLRGICLALGANEGETVHILRVREHRTDRGCSKILLLGGELIEEALVAWVDGAQEEHHLENLRDCDR